MKKLLSISLALIMCVVMASCTQGGVVGTPGSAAPASSKTATDNVVKAKDGLAEGVLGDVMRNTFFDYTVVSAAYVDTYADYTPAEGNVLIDTVIKITNVFGDEIPMYREDFQIQWGEGEEDYGYCIDPIDDTMLPVEFTMAEDEVVEYHVVYEVPQGNSEYSISYLEYFEDESEGDVFFVEFSL